MAGPSKKPQRTAPTIEATATATKATSRGARESSGGTGLNFKVDPEFAIEFKSFATQNGLSMKALLENCFNEYKRKHGG